MELLALWVGLVAGALALAASGWAGGRWIWRRLRRQRDPGLGGMANIAQRAAKDYFYHSAFPAYGPPPSLSLDVQRMAVDEALPLIGRYLDDAFRAGVPWVRIVHGKRAGGLRQAIRDALSTHPLVQLVWTPPLKEGGEGVTIVEVAR